MLRLVHTGHAVLLAWAVLLAAGDMTIRQPSEAQGVLDGWLRPPGPPDGGPPESRPVENGVPVFRTAVRMVNLIVAVKDKEGRPVQGLKSGDFDIRENGLRQELVSFGSEEVPFNLALLLDLSGSTMDQRAAMKEAARRFIGVSRPQDRVAVYAIANSLFYVVNRLTLDRGGPLERIDAIPPVGGLTPLFDSIVLACAEELAGRPLERNALIVISDGIDSSFDKYSTPGSAVRSGDLSSALEGLPVVIYPVLVGLAERPLFAGQARNAARSVARSSGGQVFEAKSLKDLEPVYEQVARELRSVYSLAYYPRDQRFDGQWRRIEVRVSRPGVSVRTRERYRWR